MTQKKQNPPDVERKREYPDSTAPQPPEAEAPTTPEEGLGGPAGSRPLHGGPKPASDIEGGTDPRAPSGGKTGGPPPL